MTLKDQMTRTALNTVLLAVLVSLFLNPISSLALGNGGTTLPNFRDFSNSVQNGEANLLRGVYVPNVLALRIVQQPSGEAGYVSSKDGEATQFRMASRFGNVGLLAHNYLSGNSFSRLSVGQEVRLMYGDGKVEYFIVTEVLRYQALQPTSPYSSFSNLDKNEILSAGQMFKFVYAGERHVTFQTCIEAEGNLSWGRLFVLAVPKSEYIRLKRMDR